MDFDQGEFNFDARGSEDGYRRWREDLDQRKREFEARWGVILGSTVSVGLKDHAKPLLGRIEWITSKKRDGAEKPRFKIRSVEFGAEEIESIVQLEEDA